MWQDSVFAPATPPSVIAYVDTLPWPDEATKQRLLSGDFTRFDTIAISLCWHKNEMTKEQAEKVSQKIATLFRDQPGQWKKQITAALICMGIPEARLLPLDWQHTRQPDRKKGYAHQMGSYRFFSWVAPDKSQYNALSSLPYFHDGPEHLLMKAAWQPYLNFSSSERLRDILRLSRVPPGFWALLGLAACIFMLKRGNIVPGVLFVGSFLLLFFSFYSVNIPGFRYSYLAFPLYFTAFAAATVMPRCRGKRID